MMDIVQKNLFRFLFIVLEWDQSVRQIFPRQLPFQNDRIVAIIAEGRSGCLIRDHGRTAARAGIQNRPRLALILSFSGWLFLLLSEICGFLF